MIAIESREGFVKACRSYIGTRFKHRGRSRNGIDCAGMIICALRDIGCDPVDIKVYGREPFKDGLRQAVQANLGEPIPDKFNVAPGDVVLIRFSKHPHHLAVVGWCEAGYMTLIHCYGDVGKVVEHRLDETWMDKIVEAYRIEVAI